MPEIVLSPKYYLDHFLELVSEIKKHHWDYLESSHLSFINRFDNLNEDAQALLVRIINRTGPLHDMNKFSYQEIVNISECWGILINHNFIQRVSKSELDLYIESLKKDEIKKELLKLNIEHKKSSSRDVLLKLLRLHKSQIIWEEKNHLVLLKETESIRFILFLYFGKLQNKLILPTLRDLGIKSSNKKAIFKPKFQNISEAKALYFYSDLREKQKRDTLTFNIEDIRSWPQSELIETKEMREKILLDLSRKAAGEEESLQILLHCHGYPGTEKKVRLLFQLGQTDNALTELERMLDFPLCDEELLFAEDFLQRKFHKKKLSLLTETLRNAETIGIDESYFRHPEFGVLNYFKDQGLQGHFSENTLWTELFWRFFQTELESDAHSEFDYAPPELTEKTFYANRSHEIERRFENTTKEVLLALVDTPLLIDFIQASALDSIFTVLRFMAQDYFARSSGFPDLFIIKDGSIIFYEVKAPGDSLKATQLIQMRNLEKAGFEVKVLQVTYEFNDEQPYVVVDLETTGGMPNYHRITEIGAVKMRGQKVIETFQTLINPERSIPHMIVGLTGITNEMVKDAPLFKDVAQSFLDFVGDAIFVAHNVNFDYGFLQQEYARLEMKFVRPYVCTKALMKKNYPGLDSYGLKKLCEHFDIRLTAHHRALCDAEAAAELLKIIHTKRRTNSEEGKSHDNN